MAAAVTIDASQEQILAVAAFPAEHLESSQLQIEAVIQPQPLVVSSQLGVYVVARGSSTDPSVRAWTFTLDGHNYYVLRLGTQETLVYDDHTQQWYTWSSGDLNIWNAYNGQNWHGGESWAYVYGSNVLVGDDGNGSIYFLNPFQDQDDSPVYGSTLPIPFRREVYGQLPFRGYKKMPCYGVQIQASIGEQADTAIDGVDLYVSDDRGQTYQDCGTINITPGDIDARLYWRSLGSMKAPGRIFKTVDYGALKRIDSMEMLDGSGK
jgi:hypothetical protein